MNRRNIAIIAHVDHGKTSLVDQLLIQSGTMKQAEDQGLIMDSNDQEKERGITIYAKNTSIHYKDNKINIIDTPWHADFSSEVERVLDMVDSVLLVVDAYEGPMPQTKFVLKKSLERGLRPLVVLNKIDKPSARPDAVVDELFDLFVTLGADDDQADFPVIYSSARDGYAFIELEDQEKASTSGDMVPLLDFILEHVPEAPSNTKAPFRMQITNLDYDNYVGRLWIGRIYEGEIQVGDKVNVYNKDGETRTAKISNIYTTLWLQRTESTTGSAGDIVTIAGIPDIYVGETIAAEGAEPFPPLTIDPPTLSMEFSVNDSPFAGREGSLVTARNISDRLHKEKETNVGLDITTLPGGSKFLVAGRWELHLSVLIESMRREGFELQVSAPQVIFKEIDGRKNEPIEHVIVSVDDSVSGSIIEMMSNRKWMMKNMKIENGLQIIEFDVPTRGLLGCRNEFILLTKGEWIMYSAFSHYEPYKGEIKKRNNGSLISWRNGEAMKYSIWKLQDRGTIFVQPAQKLYEGMIVGESAKPGDMIVNLTKNKQQSNMRTAGNDDNMLLQPIKELTLEQALGYIGPMEYVEITPESIRLRKQYLKETERKTQEKKKQ